MGKIVQNSKKKTDEMKKNDKIRWWKGMYLFELSLFYFQ